MVRKVIGIVLAVIALGVTQEKPPIDETTPPVADTIEVSVDVDSTPESDAQQVQLCKCSGLPFDQCHCSAQCTCGCRVTAKNDAKPQANLVRKRVGWSCTGTMCVPKYEWVEQSNDNAPQTPSVSRSVQPMMSTPRTRTVGPLRRWWGRR